MLQENLQNIHKIEEDDGTTFLYGGTITVVENGEFKLTKEITDSDSGIGSRESSPRNANTIDNKITSSMSNSNGMSSPESTSIVDDYDDRSASSDFVGARLPPSRNVSARRSSSETKVIEEGLHNVSLQKSPENLEKMVVAESTIIKQPLVLKFKKIKREDGATEVIIKNNTASLVDVPLSSQGLHQPLLTISTATISSTITPSTNGRQRVLSENCKDEYLFPIIEPGKVKHSFDGCKYHTNQMEHGAPLMNSANDCFMNSVLQIFTHIPQLARMIEENHNEDTCDYEDCVWCILRKHIIRATNTDKPFSSVQMKKIVNKYFPGNNEDQQDAHEFLSLLLNDLERIVTGNRHVKTIAVSPLNRPSNAIEQVLSGTMRHEISCPLCNKVNINYERYRELNLDVIAKEREKINCNLSTVFNMNFKDTPLESYRCEFCNALVTACKRSVLLRVPQLLIVQIKRFFCYPKKITATIKIEKEIDLTPFLFCKDKPVKYKLEGAIEHFGSTLAFGHYTATCKGFDRKTWYHFDDFKVRERPNIGDSTDSYVVIYSLVNPEESTKIIIPETIDDVSSINSRKLQKSLKRTHGFSHSQSVPSKMARLENNKVDSGQSRAYSENLAEPPYVTNQLLPTKLFKTNYNTKTNVSYERPTTTVTTSSKVNTTWKQQKNNLSIGNNRPLQQQIIKKTSSTFNKSNSLTVFKNPSGTGNIKSHYNSYKKTNLKE
ncbi:Ubiquitin carboxyl-terminal hydrolase 36 [Strongyloides ratti]|uniref:Ubiquitin carboxyl-terminal hydrolase 36 n=1 Tax=Strongyloides ratti TaxID=34506 RepID=A0A090LGK2_STRRB|nr:Ubiquitin carboxyl-terminal hydrolase 36 [Strongyloides ratti]CEF68931.1 Ubiquitin carboxyl-terminal hydrolase 36 [Strongyloides ratti]